MGSRNKLELSVGLRRRKTDARHGCRLCRWTSSGLKAKLDALIDRGANLILSDDPVKLVTGGKGWTPRRMTESGHRAQVGVGIVGHSVVVRRPKVVQPLSQGPATANARFWASVVFRHRPQLGASVSFVAPIDRRGSARSTCSRKLPRTDAEGGLLPYRRRPGKARFPRHTGHSIASTNRLQRPEQGFDRARSDPKNVLGQSPDRPPGPASGSLFVSLKFQTR